MNRRLFLQNAGLLAAGSAVAGSLLGCGVVAEIPIPCLGPADAPLPVPGMTYIRASQIGCALDCNLQNGRNKRTGAATATDDGPLINAAMAEASASHPITLIIDGSALISGLFLPAGGHWSIAGLGCGTGFYIKQGTNNDGIHNGDPLAAHPSDPGPPAPARGANVSLSNFTINGNGGDGRDGDSTTGYRLGSTAGDLYYFCINLMSLENITIENVVIVNSPAYHIRLSNVGHVAVSGCVVKSYTPGTDGVHLDGPANDISITNCDFTTGDDSIALNCPEGYSGNISRVTVTGCTFNSWTLMRLYTIVGGPQFKIDAVTVSNCSGTLAEAGFLIGLNRGSGPNSVASLTINDCNLTAAVILAVAENFGSIELNNVTFTPSRSKVIYVEPQANRDCGFLRPSPLYGGNTYTGSSLTFNNCRITRNQDILVSAIILENNSTIDNVEFNGFALQDAKSFSALPALINLESGSIGQIVLNSLDSTQVTAALTPAGFANVGSVAGAGVLATGWAFPDAVMANEVPYISASTHMPAIKVDGSVEPYP
jgi:hypothetical protein